jgi:predicted amidophosphoribosyltransferase
MILPPAADQRIFDLMKNDRDRADDLAGPYRRDNAICANCRRPFVKAATDDGWCCDACLAREETDADDRSRRTPDRRPHRHARPA